MGGISQLHNCDAQDASGRPVLNSPMIPCSVLNRGNARPIAVYLNSRHIEAICSALRRFAASFSAEWWRDRIFHLLFFPDKTQDPFVRRNFRKCSKLLFLEKK